MGKTLEQKKEIPQDFGEKWWASDAVLKIKFNEDWKQVHVNKKFLSTFSPYFQTFFFSEHFAEGKKDENTLDADYNVLLKYLRILHHNDNNENETKKNLVDLFNLADLYSTPIVLNYCHVQSQKFTDLKQRLLFQDAVGNTVEKKNILLSMDIKEILAYFTECPSDVTINLAELIEILRKVVRPVNERTDLSVTKNVCKSCFANLENDSETQCRMCRDIMVIPAELNEKWKYGDLILKANNSNRNLIHVYSEILKVFGGIKICDGATKNRQIKINCDHEALLEIMKILHHLKRPDFSQATPTFLASIIQALDEMNIFALHKYCNERIQKFTDMDSFEYFARLGLYKERRGAMKKLTIQQVKQVMQKLTFPVKFSSKDLRLLAIKKWICTECGSSFSQGSTHCPSGHPIIW